MKATKDQFEAYRVVLNSGLTNMLDVQAVITLALDMADTRLTREQCLDIIHNYEEYEKEYEHATNTNA